MVTTETPESSGAVSTQVSTVWAVAKREVASQVATEKTRFHCPSFQRVSTVWAGWRPQNSGQISDG